MKEPEFKKYSISLARARTLISSGVTLNYKTINGWGTLTLQLNHHACRAGAKWLNYKTGHGNISLTQSGPLLSLWGSAPVALSTSAKHWTWLYFNMDKSQTLSEVFGNIEPTTNEILPDAVHCTMIVEFEEQRVVASAVMGSKDIIRLLNSSHWRPICGNTFANLVIKIPVTVAETQLSFNAISKLKTGDIIIPERTHFDTDGLGLVTIGNRRWKIQAHTDKTPPYFEILTSDTL